MRFGPVFIIPVTYVVVNYHGWHLNGINGPVCLLYWFVAVCLILNRPEQLIDLIVNCDYWEIIDVQTIILMSISYILSNEIPPETNYASQFGAKYNV